MGEAKPRGARGGPPARRGCRRRGCASSPCLSARHGRDRSFRRRPYGCRDAGCSRLRSPGQLVQWRTQAVDWAERDMQHLIMLGVLTAQSANKPAPFAPGDPHLFHVATHPVSRTYGPRSPRPSRSARRRSRRRSEVDRARSRSAGIRSVWVRASSPSPRVRTIASAPSRSRA
jgi:hypothetical protein